MFDAKKILDQFLGAQSDTGSASQGGNNNFGGIAGGARPGRRLDGADYRH